MENVLVKLINPESGSAAEALGINPERETQLDKFIQHELIDKESYGEIIAEVSKQCKHVNELAYVAFMTGHISGHRCKSHSRTISLRDMLGQAGDEGEGE